MHGSRDIGLGATQVRELHKVEYSIAALRRLTLHTFVGKHRFAKYLGDIRDHFGVYIQSCD